MADVVLVNTRTDLLQLLPKGLCIAELGVFRGNFSEQILHYCLPKKLHLIDMWIGRAECGNQDGEFIETIDDMEGLFALMQSILEKNISLSRIVTLHRDTTQHALQQFPDGYFDFIYVDADHSEEAVYADLVFSEMKGKRLLGGHDYCERFAGVMRSVDHFCENMGWQITYLTRDKCPSYLLEPIS